MNHANSTSLKPALIVLALAISACGKEPVPEATSRAADAAEPAALQRTRSAEGARVFLRHPEDGATVSNPVKVEFGVEGMAIVKAGNNQPDSGHHHLLIDTAMPDPALPIPADALHIHFGDGSTSTELTLEPGEHTLQLLLGDYLHVPHDPPLLSNSITITVE